MNVIGRQLCSFVPLQSCFRTSTSDHRATNYSVIRLQNIGNVVCVCVWHSANSKTNKQPPTMRIMHIRSAQFQVSASVNRQIDVHSFPWTDNLFLCFWLREKMCSQQVRVREERAGFSPPIHPHQTYPLLYANGQMDVS